MYDENSLEVVTKFIDMPVCNVGTAENIYEKLETSLRNGGIPWDNLVAFNSDNCSVMKGKHHSVITKLRASQPYVQDVGCICHLAQLVTGCGIKAIKAPVEDLLGGVYSHFHKRSL